MDVTIEETICFDIYMGGDIREAEQVCREYCWGAPDNACVHVEAVQYIYKGGEETGFKVGLINYPKFPTSESRLREVAFNLAEMLMSKLFQKTCSIVGKDNTWWLSRKSPWEK